MFADPREDLAQKCFGVAAVELSTAQQTVDCCGSLVARAAAREKNILAPKCNAPQRSFCRVVFHRDATVVAIASQGLPTTERIRASRFAGSRRVRLSLAFLPGGGTVK